MKKIFTVFAAVCAAALCFTACDTGSKKDYNALNAMLDADYSALTLTVTETLSGGVVLTSEYTMAFSDGGVAVQYTVEKLAAFGDLTGEQPEDPVTTSKGSAVIRDGEVTEKTGDDIGLSANIAKTGFTFRKDYFENATLTDSSLTADVKDPAGFLGTSVTCTDMKVEAAFGEVFSRISVKYSTANGGKMEYLYNFTV